ncbi:hypothetical protein GQ55_9G478900 [Panicum hallii var. hallii]|uniref:Uncharacterized protein n=1 Tax=Panicum hallii var. hallii TaxID=1504633 RepID=A0A2T7CCS2_9POAL|nr:hypothetical protein GQ55_9G478900 [Panicum hallii var. hallii]
MVGAIAPGTMDVGSDFFLSVFPREKSLEIHTVSAWAAAGWEFGILPRWPPRPRSLSPVGAATQAAASDSSGRAGPAMRPQTRPAQVEFAQDRQRSRGALEVSPVMGSLFRHFGFSHVYAATNLTRYKGDAQRRVSTEAIWSASFRGTACCR